MELTAKRRIVGDVQYQIGTEVLTRNDFEFAGLEAVFLGYDDGGYYPPGNLSFELIIGDRSLLDSTPPPFSATVTVKDVALGASEIELDDERADVNAELYVEADKPYHGITGHLSIRELAQQCTWGCPMRASGTLNVSAIGPNGEAFALSSVTFSASDELHDGMCVLEN